METCRIYDEEFSRIEGLLHYPWVGMDYSENNTKVLILGDSHYTVNKDGSKCEKEYQECLNNKDYTRHILNDAINQEDIWNMYKGLYSLFGVSSFSAEKTLWDKVAFCNFVQQPMERRDAKPSVEQFKTAWFCLLDIIDIIKPDICLFIGIRGWVSNGYINTENRGTISLKDDTETINRCKPWKAQIKTKNGVQTRAIAIHHSSQGFAPDAWRDYLNRNAPEMLSLIDVR